MAEARPRLLFVDDDRFIRAAYERQLGKRLDVLMASTGQQGLGLLHTRQPIAAVVSDLSLPDMNGLELLGHVRARSPTTCRLLFTGRAEVQTLAQAINDVEVFRVLLRPCPTGTLWQFIDQALAHHAVLAQSQDRQGQDVGRFLTGFFASLNPALAREISRLQSHIRHVCTMLHLPDASTYELAAALSWAAQVGWPSSAIGRMIRGRPADPEERVLFDRRWSASAECLRGAPGLVPVVRIIAGVETVDHEGGALAQRAPASVGALLVRVAALVEAGLSRGETRDAVVATLRSLPWVPAEVPAALENLTDSRAPAFSVECRVADLQPGMVLETPVRTASGLTLAPAGTVLSASLVELLQGYMRTLGVVEPITIHMEEP